MPSSLRVAIVVHDVDAVGGMERQAARLAEGLAARGVAVTIVTTGRRGPWHERRGTIEIVRSPALAAWPERLVDEAADLVTASALWRRRHRLDVIYAVQFTGARHAALAAAATGLPTVVKFACGGEHGDFHVLGRREDAARLRGALGAIDRFVIISDEIRREAAAAGLDPVRFVSIRNGVDTKRFSPAGPKAELPPGRTILFAGRHDTQKRVDVLLRAFAKVAAEEPDARLVCAGSGPRLEEYRALAATLGLGERASFLGPRPDVDALLRAASVFALPSAAEGLPNALLEALATGTPCVATAIPGTTDVARHEEEALLVPLDDADALAAALLRVLRDPALAARLAAAGRRRIEDEFDMEKVADRHVELFESLARTPRRPAHAPRLAAPAASLALSAARIHARDAITATVVGAKRLLGVEGEIMGRVKL